MSKLFGYASRVLRAHLGTIASTPAARQCLEVVKAPIAIQSARLSSKQLRGQKNMEACPKVSAFEQCVFIDGHHEANWSSKLLMCNVFYSGMQAASWGGSNPVDTQWQIGIERTM